MEQSGMGGMQVGVAKVRVIDQNRVLKLKKCARMLKDAYGLTYLQAFYMLAQALERQLEEPKCNVS